MGFWGGLFHRAGQAVKNTATKVVKKVKSVCTNMWNKFSGKSTYEEAEKLYEEITARYHKRRRQFEEDIDRYVDSIHDHVQSINRSKEKIKKELFVQMAANLEKIKDISVSESFTIESYKEAVYSFDSVRSKEQLYKIDFNKHKFKTTVQAVVTLGFYTRKKAKETLYAVQEEEMKVDAEIAKMDAETVKLQAINQSLENVETYFNSLIEIYENLLVRLDNNVNYLYIRCISFAHKLVHQEMSIKRLPIMQCKEVEAIITASQILKTMTDAQILSLEDASKVKVYSDDMKKQYTAVNDVFMAA